MEDTPTKTKTFEDNFDTFNGFTEADVNLVTPMKFKAKMELRELTLMAGMNNTGKSLFNKLTWCLTFFFNIKLTQNTYNVPEEMPDKELMKFILDHSFTDQTFTGSMGMNYRDPLLKVKLYGVSMVLKDGEVTELDFELSLKTEPMGQVTYLSTDVRNFANIQKYVKLKKMMGIEEIQTFEDVRKLGEFYKIYDTFAIEFLLVKMDGVNDMLKAMKAMASSNELIKEFDIETLDYNKEKAELNYTDSAGEVRNITSLGQGAQSILIMIMTAQG